MTAAIGIRFDITDLNTGTAAIAAMAFKSTDQIAFGVVGNEMIVIRIPV